MRYSHDAPQGDPERFIAIESQIRQIANTVNKLDRVICGDDEPDNSLVVRVKLLEQEAKIRRLFSVAIMTALGVLAAWVSALCTLIFNLINHKSS